MKKLLTILFATTLTITVFGQEGTSNDTLTIIGNLISRGDDNIENFDEIHGYWIAKYQVIYCLNGKTNSDTVSVGYTCGSIPKLLPTKAFLKLLKKNEIPNYYIGVVIKEYDYESLSKIYYLESDFTTYNKSSNSETSNKEMQRDTLNYEIYKKTLAECFSLFSEYSFPNSHARPDGFDLSSYIDSIEQRRKKISKIFHTKDGIQFLKTFIKKETEDINIVCILQICLESNLPEGKDIINEYITYKPDNSNDNEFNADNIVSVQARSFLHEFDKIKTDTLSSDIDNINLIITQIPAHRNYFAEHECGVSDTSKYFKDREINEGQIYFPCENKRQHNFIIAHEKIISIISIKYDMDVYDKTDYIFTQDTIFEVHTYSTNAGLFTVSDIKFLLNNKGSIQKSNKDCNFNNYLFDLVSNFCKKN